MGGTSGTPRREWWNLHHVVEEWAPRAKIKAVLRFKPQNDQAKRATLRPHRTRPGRRVSGALCQKSDRRSRIAGVSHDRDVRNPTGHVPS